MAMGLRGCEDIEARPGGLGGARSPPCSQSAATTSSTSTRRLRPSGTAALVAGPRADALIRCRSFKTRESRSPPPASAPDATIDGVNVPSGGPRWLVAALLTVWLGSAGWPATVTGQSPSSPTRTLAGRLLVATPEMRDPRFVESVIYMVRHDATGAMGLVVNRPLQQVALAQLLERFGMVGAHAQGGVLVHWGGPVESGKAFVLHTPDYRAEGTIVVRERRGLHRAAARSSRPWPRRAGPRRLLFAVGYAGWAPGQLESELERGGWLTAGTDEELLFDDDYASKWQRATARPLIDL